MVTSPGSDTSSGLKSGQWGLLASCSSRSSFPAEADPKGLTTPTLKILGSGGENRADLEDQGEQELALACVLSPGLPS